MTRLRLLILILSAVPFVHAQQTIAHVGYVYPAGGQQGATVEVRVGGQFLTGVNSAMVSGSGVQASVVKYIKSMTNGQYNKMRDEYNALKQKKADLGKQGKSLTSDEEKRLATMKDQMANYVRKPATPAICEIVTLKITVAPDAAPGDRELRLSTSLGLTNPLVFRIDRLPEISKAPAKVVPQSTNKGSSKKDLIAKTYVPPEPTKITLPAIVNGQVGPGGVDRYKFHAAKGQDIVAAAHVRELIPYISDAVPGWFQATLAIYDSNGKELDYADHYGFHQDPVLHYQVPVEGDYVLAIHDSIYRGREDFVYRIQIGQLPYITSMFPMGGKAGARTTVELKGWNLPVTKVTEEKRKATGVYPVSLGKGQSAINLKPFAVDTLPEITEKEPNNQASSAQRVKLPIIVNGRIDKPGDWDVFRFEGRAGEEVVAEVFARRLDSPLDSILKLTDASGNQVAMNDDYEDKAAGLITHQADSRIQVKLPANGTYFLHLGDTQGQGGPEFSYRLRINHPQPDFDLRVVPASISARSGATIPITVYALRRDGFAGDIAVKLKNAPAGYLLSGGVVPASQDHVRMTLTVPDSRSDKPLKLYMEGVSTVSGHEARREAVPAEDQMQAFAYHHLVPSDDWMIRIAPRSKKSTSPTAQWKMQADQPVKLSASGSAPIRALAPLGRFEGEIRVELDEPPEGITIQKSSPVEGGVAFTLRADPAKVKAGLRGNLIVEAFLERAIDPNLPKTKRSNRRVSLGPLPAIPFEIADAVQARK
jgi:hypothetical protein